MKILIEGTYEEINKFLYGECDCEECADDDDATKDMTRGQVAQMKFLNSVAEAVAELLKEKGE